MSKPFPQHLLITAHKHLLIKIECCSMTRHFYTIRSSGMSCKFCGRAFNRGFNLRRHENEYCPLKFEEREMSKTENLISEDDASSVATRVSEFDDRRLGT